MTDPGMERAERALTDTSRTFERMAAELTPAEVRRRAALVLRCGDCGGRVVGWVIWLEGRPLFVGEAIGKGPRWASLLDVRALAPPRMRCRVRSWQLGGPLYSTGFELPAFPGPGERRAERRLSHGDGDYVL